MLYRARAQKLHEILTEVRWNIVKYNSAMEMFEFISKELWILRKVEQADNEYTGMQRIANNRDHSMIIEVTHHLVLGFLCQQGCS